MIFMDIKIEKLHFPHIVVDILSPSVKCSLTSSSIRHAPEVSPCVQFPISPTHWLPLQVIYQVSLFRLHFIIRLSPSRRRVLSGCGVRSTHPTAVKKTRLTKLNIEDLLKNIYTERNCFTSTLSHNVSISLVV